jgi:hypothetical protein
MLKTISNLILGKLKKWISKEKGPRVNNQLYFFYQIQFKETYHSNPPKHKYIRKQYMARDQIGNTWERVQMIFPHKRLYNFVYNEVKLKAGTILDIWVRIMTTTCFHDV